MAWSGTVGKPMAEGGRGNWIKDGVLEAYREGAKSGPKDGPKDGPEDEGRAEEVSDEHAMVRYRDTGVQRYFNILHGRHRLAVHNFAVKSLRDRDVHLAEDVSQAAWLNVARYRERYDGRPFTPWLFSLVASECTHLFESRGAKKRGGGRLPSSLETLPEEVLADPQDDAHTSAVLADETQAIRRRAASLPHIEARIVQAVYFKGLTLKAAAAELGIPEGTAKGRLARALARLRTEIECEGDDLAATA
jgi:RNA polymerase sigma-70 factor, ECF subfamily